MHVFPQSWSHLHILIGVFPPIGLLIGLGFYVAGMRAGNAVAKQACLALFALLGFSALPILVSGLGSMSELSGNARYTTGAINTHYTLGLAALAVLVVAGAAAALELWRVRQSAHSSGDPLNLVLGSSIAALLLTVVAAELGVPINHHELELTVAIPEISTSQVWSHAHIVLNHIPTAGFVFALAFFGVALVANNDGLRRGSLILFVICSIAGIPAYVAGTAAMLALTQPEIPEISKAVVSAHRDMALWSLFGMAFTGGASWIELWRFRSVGSFSKRSLGLVLLFAVVTLVLMTETGHRGGLINHPEIRTAADIVPTNPDAGISASLETAMKEMIWFVPWQTVHFFGYCLIFGSIFAVVLRVLGLWKSVSFAAVHRLLVLGFIGLLMNVFSGMLMMLSDSYRYVVSDVAFAPKIALVTIGAAAALYFSASDRLWTVKAGENATVTAKWVAGVALLAWAGVIVCGRLLPFL